MTLPLRPDAGAASCPVTFDPAFVYLDPQTLRRLSVDLRRVLWTPPPSREREPLTAEVSQMLTDLGARAWQAEIVGPVLVSAIIAADEEQPSEQPAEQSGPSETTESG